MRAECSPFAFLHCLRLLRFQELHRIGQGRSHWSKWLTQVVFQALDWSLSLKICFCWVFWYGWQGQDGR